MVRSLQRISREYDIRIGTFGHAGDGNLHPTILTDKRNKEEWRRVEAAIEEIFDRALALGGTLSGEHGTRPCQSPVSGKGGRTVLYFVFTTSAQSSGSE